VLGIPELLTLYRRHPGQQTSDWRTIETYWTKLVDKYSDLESVQVKRLISRARRNMTRYLSYLAYEQGDPSTALSLLHRSFAVAPIPFLADLRNCKLALACCSGLFLPERLNRRLATQAGLQHIVQRPRGS
jgi:hypothetical protein